tara:strand:- start:55 stop:513 length:459 start_codon:yes stop_codon:yes gene_type:complete
LEHNTDTVDAGTGRLGYHSLINAIILSSIDDLGYDALTDEGTLDWINAPEDTNYNVESIRKGMAHLPQHDGLGPYKSECCKGKIGCRKGGMPNPKLAIRRVMENLDARDIGIDVAEVEVHFDQVDLDNIAEPTAGELGELENELKNITWESE